MVPLLLEEGLSRAAKVRKTKGRCVFRAECGDGVEVDRRIVITRIRSIVREAQAPKCPGRSRSPRPARCDKMPISLCC